jgi:hypothetical protein
VDRNIVCVCIAHYGALLSGCGQARGWPGLLIFYLLPCAAHPTCPCPNCPELSPGRMGWSWNRQNHPERPLWPEKLPLPARATDSRWRPTFLPSPEQREERGTRWHRWVRVSNRHAARAITGNSMPGRPFSAGQPNPPFQIASFGNSRLSSIGPK